MFDSWLIFAFGVVLGVIIASVLKLVRTAGTLKIDCSDPKKDLYMFEIDDLDSLSKKKRVTLKVVKTANLSQN